MEEHAVSTETMTSRERILATMRGEIPDRVPVQLGITNMFSVRRHGFNAWDIFLDHKRPYWQIVADTAREFGLDGYLYLHAGRKGGNREVKSTSVTLDHGPDAKVIRTVIATPEGDLTQERTVLRWETSTVTEGLVKSADDFRIWMKYCLHDGGDLDFGPIQAGKAYLGEDGTAAACVGIPGLASLCNLFEGRLEAAVYFACDHPELFTEYAEKATAIGLKTIERLIDSPADYIQIGSSGTRWYT